MSTTENNGHQNPEPQKELKLKGNTNEDKKCPDCDMEEFLCDSCSSAAMAGSRRKPTNPDPSGLFGEMEDEETGRHLVALKDIPTGTILWKERPLVAAHSNNKMLVDRDALTCAGCFSLMPKQGLVKCKKCGWLVCGKQCSEMSDHKLNECGQKAPHSYAESGQAPFTILGYRAALLKSRDPAMWADLMDMRDTLVNQLDPMVDYIKKFQLEEEIHYLKIQDLISLEEYEKIFHIMKLNSLGLSNYYEDQQNEKRFGLGLYKKTSLMTFSCIPNCGVQIDLPPSHELRVHAATLIKRGERLTRFCRERIAGLKYLGGVAQRQQALQQDGFNYFRCKCDLCSDSTEKGTNLSTLVCQSCKNLSLLPLNPGAQALGNFENWEWKCRTVGCTSKSVTNSELNKLNEIILAISKAAPMTEKDFKACSNRWLQLKSSFKNRVHSNYWAIVAAASELCRQYCHCYAPPLDSPDWKHHEEIMVYLLGIFDVIRPGVSVERARLQNSLMKARYLEIYRHSLKQLQSSRDPEEFRSVISNLEKAMDMGKEALKYFKLDPSSKMLKEVEMLISMCQETTRRVTHGMVMAQMGRLAV